MLLRASPSKSLKRQSPCDGSPLSILNTELKQLLKRSALFLCIIHFNSVMLDRGKESFTLIFRLVISQKSLGILSDCGRQAFEVYFPFPLDERLQFSTTPTECSSVILSGRLFGFLPESLLLSFLTAFKTSASPNLSMKRCQRTY